MLYYHKFLSVWVGRPSPHGVELRRSGSCRSQGAVLSRRCRMALKLDITRGPDGLSLEHAVFHGDSSARLTVTFSVEFARAKIMVLAEIDGATRADGSGHEWIIEGRIVDLNDPRPFFKSIKGSSFRGQYSTQDRKGELLVGNLQEGPCGADLCHKTGSRFWCQECQGGYCSECGLLHVCFSGHPVRALPQRI